MRHVQAALEQQIRGGYAAFLRGDIDAVLDGFLPEATFSNPDYAIEGGVRQGRDELRTSFQALREGFEYVSLEVEELVDGPKGVLVLVRFDARGKGSGAPIRDRFAHVFRVAEGRIVDFAWFRSEAEGRSAAGLD